MVGLRLDKEWMDLEQSAIDSLPAQLGVYEIADVDDQVLKIGYAGGTQPFGMRTALEEELASASGSVRFRFEFNHGYLTRWEELLMVHQADFGRLPIGNIDHPHKLGRLSVQNPLTKGA